MKQENCCCGASLKIAYDCDGVYDQEVIDLFNRLHSGPGHDQRVTAAESNNIRHFYGARRDRKAAAERARAQR